MAKLRSSNFELLRIIAMVLIIFHHFSVHGGFEFDMGSITLNQLWVQFIIFGGKVGVNVFMLITGYFMINSDKLSIKKAVKLILQLIFYSVGIYIIFVLLDKADFSLKTLATSAMPITFEKWWFASTYFVIFLLSPFINEFLRTLEQQKYKQMLIVMFICWSIIPTIFSKLMQSNNFVWLIFIYMLGGYIRLYGFKNERSSKFYLSMSMLSLIATFSLVVLFDILGLRFDYFQSKALRWYNAQIITTVAISLFLFLTFKNLKIGYSKLINTLGGATFGVYLIHDSYFVRNFLWKDLFCNNEFAKSDYLILYSIGAVCAVYIACTLIELLRQHFVERYYMKLYDFVECKLKSKTK